MGMRSRQNGIALIAVLWTLTLLSLIGITLAWESHTGSQIARNVVESASARAAADAGVERAILDLSSRPGRTEAFRTDGTTYVWRFAECTVYISIRDEASKIDLNKAPPPLLAALFVSIGVSPEKAQSLADAIADFRDTDDMRRPSGAEASDYRDAGFAWGPKNAPFEVVEELQEVIGMRPEIYEKAAPDLSVYSLTSTIPATADERLSGIVRRAGFIPQPPTASPRQAFSIRAEARSANGATFVRNAIIQLKVRQGNVELGPLMLSWSRG